MKTINAEEEEFVQRLLAWDRMHRMVDWIFCYLLLLGGGGIIVVVALMTVRNLEDRTILWFTIPGFLLGLIMIGAYILEDRRIKERRIIASILKKLLKEA